MTDTTRFLGLAKLKVEGELTTFDPEAPPLTDEDIAAYKAAQEASVKAMESFETAMRSIPTMIDPKWLAAQYALALDIDTREPITYLRRLVLWRIANGGVLDADQCAKIVMPDLEESFSIGW